MNMKKIVAGVAASALAVSAMAVAAFADGLMTKTGNESQAEKYIVSFEGLTEDQINSITKVEAKVSVDTNSVNGCIGINDATTGKWNSVNGEVAAETGPVEGSFVAEFEAGAFAAKDEDGNLAPYCEVQFWWVNPYYDEDGKEGDPGTATLESVTLYDAAGNVVAPATEAPETEAPETEAPETEAPADDQTQVGSSENVDENEGDNSQVGTSNDNPGTGVGVAVVPAVLAAGALAAAAVIRKRK